jgi:hypothetical protein
MPVVVPIDTQPARRERATSAAHAFATGRTCDHMVHLDTGFRRPAPAHGIVRTGVKWRRVNSA